MQRVSSAFLCATAAALLCTQLASAALTFASIGDWGDASPAQTKVAHALASVSAAVFPSAPSFVLSLGDSFYPMGVSSVNDPKWAAVYENVYAVPPGEPVPWYPVLGERDHAGNATAPVLYRGGSGRWQYDADSSAPAFSNFYTKTKTIDGVGADATSAKFVFVDTYQIMAVPLDQQLPALMAWIENQLKPPATGAAPQWLIVVGHHPVASVGTENTPAPDAARLTVDGATYKSLLTLLREYQVDAYLCAHDHSQQHITLLGLADKTVAAAAASRLEVFVNGVGGATPGSIALTPANAALWTPDATGAAPLKYAAIGAGFAVHTIFGVNMTTTFYDANGQVLYRHVQYPRNAFTPADDLDPPTSAEKAVLAMALVFVIGCTLVILGRSYWQHQKDKAAAAQRQNNGLGASSNSGGGGSSSGAAIGVAGDGKFETMAVVSSAGPDVDSKDSL